jgi:hypothetical protein
MDLSDWSEIIRFSNGSPEDKTRAVDIVFSNPKLFTHNNVIELVRTLSKASEPEIVRLALAKGLENKEITVGVSQELSKLLTDPSEVVREQALVSQARAEAYAEQLEVKTRLIRGRLWPLRVARRWLMRQKLRGAVIIAFLLGASVAILVHCLKLPLSTSAMTSLSQVNATIFALAFTIPLAASQFSTYPSRPESLFDTKNLLYFATYIPSIFLALIAPADTILAALTLGLSVTCAVLVVPYLFRTGLKLKPKRIIEGEKTRVLRRWREDTEEGLAEPGSEIENLARMALGRRDYQTFETSMVAMISLVRESMKLPVRSKTSPLQPGAAGLSQAVQRIGEACVEDSLAVAIWCSKILDLGTRKSFVPDETTNILKYVEYDQLSHIIGSSASKGLPYAIPMTALIEWAILNQPSGPDDSMDRIDRCVGVLQGLPLAMVDEAFRSSWERIQPYPLLESVFSPIRPFMLSYLPRMKRHLEEMLAKCETRFSEIACERLFENLTLNTPATIDLAKPEDALQITTLQRSCYSQESAARNDWQIPPAMETTGQLVSAMKESVILTAKIEGIVVGSVRASLEKNQFLIRRLFVHRRFRGKGVGSQLLGEIERRGPVGLVQEAYVGYYEPERVRFLQKRAYAVYALHTLSNTVQLVYMKK